MAMPHLSPDVFPRSVVAVDSSPYKHWEYEFGCKVVCYNCLLLILLKVQILLANFSNMHLWICWYQMIFCFYLKASAWLRLKWGMQHPRCYKLRCGTDITMRKNLPKTLDQLIFCKCTLNALKFTKYLVNVHKFTKYLVNSYHQKDVKHYVLTNWYQMTSI